MSTTDESVQRSSKMKEIVSLTQLRAIALLLVFICHSPSIPGIRELAHGLNVFTPLGQIGVGLFFILSGFVLGHNYLSLRICSGREYFQYLWNRLARLYPTHFVTFLIAIPLSFYAFYMFHQLVLRYAHGGLQFMGCRPFGAFSVLLVVIIYAVAVLFSIKWTRYVEIPIAAFLKRKNPFTNSEQR